MMPLGPQLMRTLSIDPKQFGILVSAYTISAGICGLLGTFIAEKFERKHFMIFMNIGFIMGTFYCSQAYSFNTLLLGRIVAGGFGGLLGSTIIAMVADYVPEQRRGSAMGIVMAAFPIASVVGVPIGLMLANKFGWQQPFFFLATIALSTLFMSFISLPKVNNKIVKGFHPLDTIKKILYHPTHINAFFLLQILMFSIFLVIPYISPYLVANTVMTEEKLPLMYFFGGGVTFFTSQLYGKLTDKKGPKNIFLILGFISIIPITLLTHLEPTYVWQIILVACFFMSFVSGRNVPAITLMLSKVRPETRGSFMTMSNSFQQLAVGLASYLGGVIIIETADGRIEHYDRVGYFAIFMTLVGILVGYLLSKKPAVLSDE
jgi:predicted MFS family arabinose efflux permease